MVPNFFFLFFWGGGLVLHLGGVFEYLRLVISPSNYIDTCSYIPTYLLSTHINYKNLQTPFPSAKKASESFCHIFFFLFLDPKYIYI